MFKIVVLCGLILAIDINKTVLCKIIFGNPNDSQHSKRCGFSDASKLSPLLVDGIETQSGTFPWHAGLFVRQEKDEKVSWEQICGGSLLTDQFVLTAAHCVFKRKEQNVRVALGKVFRSWDRDEHGQQKRNVSKIMYPDDFQQVTYYFDIALLLLDEKVRLGDLVMPVCSGLLDGSNHILDKKLFVVGWGQTDNTDEGSLSEKLRYTDVKFMPENDCRNYIPSTYVMFEKFCTIKDNKTAVSTVQHGDSGGGLTVVHGKQHYIFGIVSTKITYFNNEISLFTNLTWPYYTWWIESKMREYVNNYRWSENGTSPRGCVLPNMSPIRRYCSLTNRCVDSCNFDNENCLVPLGSSADQVKVVCAPGYIPEQSNYGISFCLNGKWVPPISKCQKLCHPLESEMLRLTCRIGANIVDCSKPALPYTTVSIGCAPTFSEYPDLRREGVYIKIYTCQSSGDWSDNLPICKPACGVSNKEVKVLSPTIVDGQKAHLGFFPWHAGLYYSQDGKIWEQKCAGSLINKRFILTAAHCVKPIADDLSNIRVALGKYYRSWDTNERSEQRRNVLGISIPSQYNPETTAFNIALMLLNESIRFGEYIMPVCLDFEPGRNKYGNNDSYIAGWGKTANFGSPTFEPGRNKYGNNDLYVAGWGKTANFGSPSDVLLYNTVTAMDENECRRSIPAFYNTFENICTVKRNNSQSITQAGDSGGGLTAVYGDGLHYIIGITSSKVDNISVFTNIKWHTHIDWIQSEMRRLSKEYV